MPGCGAGGFPLIEKNFSDGFPVAGQRHLMGDVIIGEGGDALFQAVLFPSAPRAELDIASLRKSLPCHHFDLLLKLKGHRSVAALVTGS